MPPRQVYGKRSRVKYDPVEIFGNSSEGSSPIAREAEGPREAEVSSRKPDRKQRNPKINCENTRRVLRDLGTNGVPLSPEIILTRHCRRRKMVRSSEDEDAATNAEETQDAINVTVSSLKLALESAEVQRVHGLSLLSPSKSSTSPCEENTGSLLSLCTHPVTSFSDWADQLNEHFTISKIAEASFGQVFRISLRHRLSGLSASDESVFKIIPLHASKDEPSSDRRKEETSHSSSPEDVANEVRLLQRMSSIPGFTNFRDVRIVQGRPPKIFQQAWRKFNTLQRGKRKETSYFPDPAKKFSYPEDQLWAVIEMQDAGTDLEQLVETGNTTSIYFVWDVFWQVVLSLAKGEESAEFEHRDLHLGNICVHNAPASSSPEYIDTKRKLDFTGIETTIIDYTLSRARMADSSIAYHDLAKDTTIFEGDSTEEYQYDIYRYMRGIVLHNNAYYTPSSSNTILHNPQIPTWQQYTPTTNLLWLHFILYKLLSQVSWPSKTKAPSRTRRRAEFVKWKRANDLQHVLLKVQDLLDPGVICERESVRCAGDLVGLAMGEGWLDEGDVVGEVESELVQGLGGLEI